MTHTRIFQVVGPQVAIRPSAHVSAYLQPQMGFISVEGIEPAEVRRFFSSEPCLEPACSPILPLFMPEGRLR